ncbi:hypothetical protein M0638_01920 [Roseomonas sp. NAR14]|uniref:Uncharacterized protein n=1 Tax=Roseomonas acroporae TaxID=2937791 RepID=A0A9X1YAX5_9PROT|nr:hypothetical protein [Roseomonas acroporae]MCK8783136.1 hypothetical protein [Roseomonas acroporae]
MQRRDWIGLAVAALALGGMLAFRAAYVEPRAWGALCAAPSPFAAGLPLPCYPRAALLWLQNWQLWGLSALLLGLLAFLRAAFVPAVAAVALGAVAVANYNASWGMLGLALGAWAWLRLPRPSADGQDALAAGPRH